MPKTRTITSYRHPPQEATSQQPDTAPGPYYVSVKDGPRVGLLAGPFATHQEALDHVEAARAKAHELNPVEAAFAGFGTCRLREPKTEPGLLNGLLGIVPTYGKPKIERKRLSPAKEN